mmetsp:Transcript_58832/g.149310  ORF Transcript_58832/g.149310 Transcript_58832/m.149310 type:complete len:294 (-) Transcript_58832:138-1019(-)
MALSSTAASGMPLGYEQDEQIQRRQGGAGGGGGAGGYSSTAAVSQLFARLSQEIEEKQPKNCIHFMVDFLCKHYPEHLHGFASIWQMDPDLERERHEVVNFFKAHKISTAVAAHFTNAGYDTLDTLTTLTPDSLVDVEAFNNVKWLPGHKVRLQQIFGEISARVRAYRQEYEKAQGNQSPRGGRHHHSSHQQHHQSSHQGHSSSPHYGNSSPAHPAVHRPAVSMVHQGASPYAGAHALQHASPYGHLSPAALTAGVSAPSFMSAGIGHGVAPPALPHHPGNLFAAQYSPYPSA